MSERFCSKCAAQLVLPGQRWCRACKNASANQRAALARKAAHQNAPGTGENGAEQGGGEAQGWTRAAQNGKAKANGTPSLPGWLLAEPQPFTPYRDSAPQEEWQTPFLVHYATHGGKALAAEAAGVTMKTVKHCLAVDPAFAEELDEAYRFHCDLLEWESLSLARRRANPLPYFDRLKAELPARHVDRALVASVSVGTELPAADVLPVLAKMLASCTDATRALLTQGQVIEGLPALSETDTTR